MKFSSAIYDLCVRKNWFTGGSSEAYRKMLDACNNPAYSTRDIAIMIYLASDASFNEILQAVDAERIAYNDNNLILSNKDYAAFCDIFSGEVIHGCTEIVRTITEKPCKIDAIDDVYYACEYHQQFEMLAMDLIRQAHGLTFESDETSF